MSVMTQQRPRYQISSSPLAEMGYLYRRWSKSIDEFRIELDTFAIKGGIQFYAPDGPERCRRKKILASLAQSERRSDTTIERYMKSPDLLDPPWQVRLKSRVRVWIGRRQATSQRAMVTS